MKILKLLTPIIATSVLSGCLNVFSPIDKPSGDAQLKSAARACFDQGDLDCAKNFYGKITGTSDAEFANAEIAFSQLEQNGVSMGTFIEVLGGGQLDKALGSMTKKLKANAGVTLRLAFLDAYKKVFSISENIELKGLVRFATAFPLAAEILAENTDADGVLRKSDLAKTPASCATTQNCIINANCSQPSGKKLAIGSLKKIVKAEDATADYTGDPTLGMFQGAMDAILQAIDTELLATGKFQTGTGDLVKTFNTFFSQGNLCYRAVLINNGIGE